MTDRKPLPRTIRGGRPYFFDDPAIDKVLNMVVTLGSEVWALRERLAALEGIQQRQGSLGQGEVDAYEFTPDEETALAAERKEFIDNLFRILQEHVDVAASKSRRAADAARGKPGIFGARIARVAKPAAGSRKRARGKVKRRKG